MTLECNPEHELRSSFNLPAQCVFSGPWPSGKTQAEISQCDLLLNHTKLCRSSEQEAMDENYHAHQVQFLRCDSTRG